MANLVDGSADHFVPCTGASVELVGAEVGASGDRSVPLILLTHAGVCQGGGAAGGSLFRRHIEYEVGIGHSAAPCDGIGFIVHVLVRAVLEVGRRDGRILRC